MNRETSTNFGGKPEMVKKGNSQKKKRKQSCAKFCDSRDVPVTTLMVDVAQTVFRLGRGVDQGGARGARKPAPAPETEAREEA